MSLRFNQLCWDLKVMGYHSCKCTYCILVYIRTLKISLEIAMIRCVLFPVKNRVQQLCIWSGQTSKMLWIVHLRCDRLWKWNLARNFVSCDHVCTTAPLRLLIASRFASLCHASHLILHFCSYMQSPQVSPSRPLMMPTSIPRNRTGRSVKIF